MKKFTLFLVIICMTFSLVGCNSDVDESIDGIGGRKYTGSYTLYGKAIDSVEKGSLS